MGKRHRITTYLPILPALFYIGWCASLAGRVHVMRAEVASRVAWVRQIEAASTLPAEDRIRTLEQIRIEVLSEPGLLPKTRETFSDPQPQEGRLISSLRMETGILSGQLGEAWDIAIGLLFGAGLFSIGFIVLLARSRRDQDRLEQQATELRASAEELRRAERGFSVAARRLEALMQGAPLGIAFLKREGTIELQNPILSQIVGTEDPNGLWGAPRGTGPLPAELLERALTGSVVSLDDHRIELAHGEVRADILLFPLSGDGVTEGLALLMRDVTQASLLRAELDRNTRLVSVGRMAAGVGHELRNPLTFVTNNLDEVETSISPLLQHLPPDEAEMVVSATADLRAGIHRIKRLASDLLDLRATAGPDLRLVNPTLVLQLSCRMVQTEIEKVASFHSEIPELPEVIADPDLLSQVFVNLLSNARRALRDGREGKIHLIAKEEQIRDRRWIRVVVEDNGVGIPAPLLERLFDPFFTTRKGGEGVGLGLTIVKNTLDGMNARIEVEGRPGQGARFHVLLPVYQSTESWDHPGQTG